MKHNYEVHEPKCLSRDCFVCHAGVSHCTVCHCTEDGLATECPGERVPADTQVAIAMGGKYYVDGEWVTR